MATDELTDETDKLSADRERKLMEVAPLLKQVSAAPSVPIRC